MHSFENRRVSISEFLSCVTSEDSCGRAVPHLQNDSYGDFQHSKECKYMEKYLSKFSNVHKRKQTSLLAKVNSRCFFLFPAASILISINLCETLCQITRVWNTAQTWGVNLLTSFIEWFSIFILMAWQWKPAIVTSGTSMFPLPKAP